MEQQHTKEGKNFHWKQERALNQDNCPKCPVRKGGLRVEVVSVGICRMVWVPLPSARGSGGAGGGSGHRSVIRPGEAGPTPHCSHKGGLITSDQDQNHSPEELGKEIKRQRDWSELLRHEGPGVRKPFLKCFIPFSSST